MGDDFDPYYRWLAIPPEQQPADHYRLLGLKRYESAPDVIDVAADRQMLHIRNFAAGKYSELSQRLLNEIAAARLCLLDAKQRAEYDKQLHVRYAQPAKKSAAKPASIPPAPAPSELEALTQVAPPPSAVRRGKARKSSPAWIPAALVLAIVAAGVGAYFVVTRQNAADASRSNPSAKSLSKGDAKAEAKKPNGRPDSKSDAKPLVSTVGAPKPVTKPPAANVAVGVGKHDGAVYLDDLDERQSLTYYGGVGRRGHTGFQGQSVAIYRGVQPKHSLAVHPTSDSSSLVVYQLDGKFRRFQAVATLIDYETPPTTPLIFKVLGDGRVLWESRPIQQRIGQVGESQQCDVAIDGVRELRLVVECPGINNGADAIWIEPKVAP